MTGAVLAGGSSTRMGQEKGLVQLAGRPLAGIVAAHLKRSPGVERVLLVTNHPERFADLGWEMIADRHPGRGPLAGIHAALHSAEDWVFVAGCDMPFLPAELPGALHALRAGVDLVLPRVGGHAATVAALYGPGCLPVLEEALRGEGPRLAQVLPALRVREVGEDQLARWGDPALRFLSVNSPRDLTRAAALAEGGDLLW